LQIDHGARRVNDNVWLDLGKYLLNVGLVSDVAVKVGSIGDSPVGGLEVDSEHFGLRGQVHHEGNYVVSKESTGTYDKDVAQ